MSTYSAGSSRHTLHTIDCMLFSPKPVFGRDPVVFDVGMMLVGLDVVLVVAGGTVAKFTDGSVEL